MSGLGKYSEIKKKSDKSDKHKQKNRKTEKQKNRKTDKQKNRQTDKFYLPFSTLHNIRNTDKQINRNQQNKTETIPETDPGLYYLQGESDTKPLCLVTVHVDDIAATSKDETVLQALHNALIDRFKEVTLDKTPTQFLGVEIQQQSLITIQETNSDQIHIYNRQFQ